MRPSLKTNYLIYNSPSGYSLLQLYIHSAYQSIHYQAREGRWYREREYLVCQTCPIRKQPNLRSEKVQGNQIRGINKSISYNFTVQNTSNHIRLNYSKWNLY